MRGRPEKKYWIDGRYLSEKEGIKLIKSNLKSKGVRYSDYLKEAKAKGRLENFHSLWSRSF